VKGFHLVPLAIGCLNKFLCFWLPDLVWLINVIYTKVREIPASRTFSASSLVHFLAYSLDLVA